ncbi:GNAT family N-acetyltransferase [Microbulbifer sp. 2205BS26-8]|uniref:GNAT family N-acetyltransferase n=1 Tax=Microbulbifer sp. 2205BS26-8 TaxID=3064386 RepID=UPI00273F0DE2|nr:GNAT family protein [Microbulbifer sp. 2205BS26-8]MDP5211299.1 GNAT family protein [Microbulbifer sp. 2205BS26-8]
MKTPILKTERFIIRSFEEKDLEAFAQYRSQPEIAKFQNWTDYSYQNALDLFKAIDYSNFNIDGNWYQLAIVKKKTDELIGDLAVHFIDGEQQDLS